MSISTKDANGEVVTHKEANENTIEMKSYILDDFKALKKKFNMINHNPPIDVNGEASNGASINVDMKTSMFELMKKGLVEYLKKQADIQKIEFPVTSKAQSKNGEEADVEYQVEVTFVVAGITEKIKMKCFTTNCRVQVQNFGKHVRKEHLGMEYSPKFFVQRFIVPYLESIMDEAMEVDKVFVPHLRAEIQRLQKRKIQDKVRKSSALDTDPKNAKCVNNCCQWVNVILKNVEAYGICIKCQGFEHHHCAGTSKMMKEEMKKGKANFICTNCLETNPALGKQIAANTAVTHDTNKAIEYVASTNKTSEVQSLTNQADVVVDLATQEASVTKEIPTEIEETEIVEAETFTCKLCEFACNVKRDLIMHEAENHPVQICPQLNCKTCEKQFVDEGELYMHEQTHTRAEVQCDKCDYKSNDKALLDTHMEFVHESPITFKCTVCNNGFVSKVDLVEHMQLHEEVSTALQCDLCLFKAISNTELEKHNVSEHPDSVTNDDTVTTNINNEGQKDQNDSPLVDAETRLKMMEESYDRLMALYSKQQNDYKSKVTAYKAELENTYECLRVVKIENEKLREINETQHKLWKIFVEKFDDKEAKTNDDKEATTDRLTKKAGVEEIEIVDEDDDDKETEEAYQEWLVDTRKRGFKRSSPSCPPERIQGKNAGMKSYAEAVAAPSKNIEKQSKNTEKPDQNFVRYCHNWNNLGKCSYEKCRFAHENAPVCSYDGNCTRQKCMFSHKKQNFHFLAKKSKPQTSSWQTMGGSWPNSFSFPPNPWNNPSPPNPWSNQFPPNPWINQAPPNRWNISPMNRRN